MKCPMCGKDSLITTMRQTWYVSNPPKYAWTCGSRIACRWRMLVNIFKPLKGW